MITLGFSPCPNDTFMFDALVHHKIDTEGLEFDVIFADIEKLNDWSIQGKLDVTKISYHAFMYCTDQYLLLDSGSALGSNCGPILIKKDKTDFSESSRIAIPGRYTTANMLLDIAYPLHQNRVEVLFSDIEYKLLINEFDAGLIIHENRFTYQEKGLVKIMDLGEFWEEATSLPIPLGGIVVNRNLSLDTQQKVQRVLKRSIEYAFDNKQDSYDFIRSHSQELEDDVIESHIDLYVNDYSISLGSKGKEAISRLLEDRNIGTDIFLDSIIEL